MVGTLIALIISFFGILYMVNKGGDDKEDGLYF